MHSREIADNGLTLLKKGKQGMIHALFGRGGRPPRVVTYLGQVLPPAVIAMLIIYCLKNIDFFAGSRGLPELLCVAVVAILHVWKGNNLLSIFGGTILYMVLVQAVFV